MRRSAVQFTRNKLQRQSQTVLYRRFATEANVLLPVKKKRRFRNFVLLSSFLLVSAYGVGAYLTTQNDRVRNMYAESVPFGRAIVDYLEESSLKELGAAKGQIPTSKKAEESLKSAREKARLAGEELKAKRDRAAQETARIKAEAEKKAQAEAAKLQSKAKQAQAEVKQRAEPVKQKAIEVKESVQEKVERGQESLKDLVTRAENALKGIGAAPAVDPPMEIAPVSTESQAINATAITGEPVGLKSEIKEPLPLGFEAAPGVAYKPVPQRKLISAQEKAALLPPPLPLIAPSIAELASQEPIIGQLASTIDNLTGFLKDNPTNASRADTVKDVLSTAEIDLKTLGSRLHAIRSEEHAKLEAQLDSQQKEYQAQIAAKEQDLMARLSSQEEDWRTNFDLEREKFREEYRSRLESELEVQKELINERLKEELVAQGIEMQRKWLRDIKVKVEQERGGRLAKLDQLSTDVQKLQQAAFANDAHLDDTLRVNRLWAAIQAAQGIEGRRISDELIAIKELAPSGSSDSSTVNLALETIRPETAEQGITSFPTLTDWFTSRVAPKIKRAALMPERGGCLSYFTSAALSPFLFEKAGYAQGNDVMAVISRAHYFLGRRDLEGAAREINQLQGWPKILARDWLEASRRHLEVKQALSVAETETKLNGFLVI